MKAGSNGLAKLGWLSDIEEVRAELHVTPLRNGSLLVDGEVPFLEGWTAQRVASHVAEVPRADDWQSEARPVGDRHIDAARNRKRTQVEIVVRDRACDK